MITSIKSKASWASLDWCDFVVWLGSGGIVCERTLFSEELWSTNMLPSLTVFYHTHTLSHLSQISAKPFSVSEAISAAIAETRQANTGSSSHSRSGFSRKATATNLSTLSGSTPLNLCFSCKKRQPLVLRRCATCSKRYHHMCQNVNENGKCCNDCFRQQAHSG